MLKQRQAAGQLVATRLIATEHAIDNALINASELTSDILEARKAINIAAHFGQEALEQTSKAAGALMEARRAIIEAHRELAETQVQIGLREHSFGGLPTKSPKVAAELALVSEAA